MRLNKNELRAILYDFNSRANRLLQANYDDYLDVLTKFVNYIKSVPIIIEYIEGCGVCEFDLENEFREIRESYGRAIFSIGETDEKEICNVFAVLQFIVDNNINVNYSVTMGYSSSNKYQDKLKGFNDRFVMVLIRHIENYLTNIGIKMGIDDNVIYNVTVNSGQAIIATDNAVVTATNNIGLDFDELQALIDNIKSNLNDLTDDEQCSVSECLEVIEVEAKSAKPKRSLINTAKATLQAIKGSAEFVAATIAIVEFLSQINL